MGTQLSLESLFAELQSEDEAATKATSALVFDVDAAESQIREQTRNINYLVNQYTVAELVRRFESSVIEQAQGEEGGEFYVPYYQREFVWPPAHQSEYIETLLIGLPVPPLLLAQDEKPISADEGRVEIIDGSQRVRTLHRFLRGKLVLTGLTRLSALNGAAFGSLHPSRQRKFERINIRVYELPDTVLEDDRMDVFRRVNTSSLTLSSAEVRRGAFRGAFYEGLRRLSKDSLVQEMIPVGEQKGKRQELEELLLRFFAYSDAYQNFKKKVAPFLSEFIRTHQDQFPDEYRDRLLAVLTFVKTYFPNGFRKGGAHRTVPRVRFEAIAVGAALALKEQPNLIPVDVLTWLESDRFTSLTTSDGSNSAPRLRNGVEFVRDALLMPKNGA